MSKVNLDETDKSVLRCIMADPRSSIADIARTLGVQRDTVTYRLERMEKRGLIQKYNVIVEPAALGCEVFMQVSIKLAPVSQERSDGFVEMLVAHPNVTHIERLIGKYNYAVQMAAENIAAFDVALDEIKQAGQGILTEIDLANIIDGPKINDFSGLV